MGFVVLAEAGADALCGHGPLRQGAIRKAWFCVALPALALNYFGQGALLLRARLRAIQNPFYLLAPDWAVMPMVVLYACRR